MHRWARWFDTLTVVNSGGHERSRHAARVCRRHGWVALLAAGLLTGCGQSGPLTLPTRDVEAATAPATDEQVTEEEQESEEDEE